MVSCIAAEQSMYVAKLRSTMRIYRDRMLHCWVFKMSATDEMRISVGHRNCLQQKKKKKEREVLPLFHVPPNTTQDQDELSGAYKYFSHGRTIASKQASTRVADVSTRGTKAFFVLKTNRVWQMTRSFPIALASVWLCQH